jgi:hypothetical protein
MMLYKYVPFATGKAILQSGRVCFSLPKYFNDPFDKPRYPREKGANPLTDIFGSKQIWGKELVWGANTGILSLTRTPTNPLMWAHYAEMHKGMVIGIDAVAAGFTDESSNLIPAQFGSVIYVSRRPTQQFISKSQTPLAVGATHHFASDHYEKLQRIFLHKPLYWAYEEEVRVLKCLGGLSEMGGANPSGDFKIIKVNDKLLHLLALPKGALKEVYFGLRSEHDQTDDLYYEAKEIDSNLRFFDCQLDDGAFTVEFAPYATIAETAD